MCILNTVEYSALVRSRKYNKERGQLMSHGRKNSLLFDMCARAPGHTCAAAQTICNESIPRTIYILSMGFQFVETLQNGNVIIQQFVFNFHLDDRSCFSANGTVNGLQ